MYCKVPAVHQKAFLSDPEHLCTGLKGNVLVLFLLCRWLEFFNKLLKFTLQIYFFIILLIELQRHLGGDAVSRRWSSNTAEVY